MGSLEKWSFTTQNATWAKFEITIMSKNELSKRTIFYE